MSLFHTILFIGVCASICAEVFALMVPGKIIGLMEKPPEEIARSRFVMLLVALSMIYIVTTGMLLFSGDRVFTLYAAVLFMLSSSLWLLRRWIRHLRVLMTVDSTVCLIILIDVARTLLRGMR